MRIFYRMLSAVCICSVLTGSASAATIRKKDGQIIRGEINGRIVQKGKIEESQSRYKHSVAFIVIDGKDIETIDENGVNPIKGRIFPTILYFFNEEKAPVDTWILELGETFLGMSSDVTMNVGGGLLGIKRLEGKNLTDPLIGELVKEGKSVRIISTLRVSTDKGQVEIPVNEIMDFNPRK